MSQDQQTYKRAAVAAIIGLCTHGLLAVGLALIGLATESVAIHAAAWHLFGGLPIWVILWVIYHQHQLERIEALETEQLARADAQAAALFDEAGQQLAVARKRLGGLYRYGLGVVSLGVSAYLVIVGGVLLWNHWGLHQDGRLAVEALSSDVNHGAVALLVAAVGFIAFIAARYVSGMTRVQAWQLLRGGAGYLMGAVVNSLLLLVGVGFSLLGNPQVFAWVALLIPALMVLLGGEILLGFILGLYRPRVPGQVDRPAFDSRLLGWFTSPESIGKIVSESLNYQFGFEISRSWFYELLARAIVPLTLIGIAVLIGMTSVVIVAPHQQAVITTFGGSPRVVDSGLRVKWPWPVGKVRTYDFYRVHEISVGSRDQEMPEGVAILWTNEHGQSQETYLVTAPAEAVGQAEGDVVAGELMGAQVVVKYRLADLLAYTQSAESPEAVLRVKAEERVHEYFVTRSIDTLLTRGRAEAGRVLFEQLSADATPLGLEVVFVGVTGVHPPQAGEVAAAFHEQIEALQEKQTTIEEARRDAVTTLAKVAGSRQRAIEISEAIAELEELRQRAEPGGPLADEAAAGAVAVEQLMDEAGGRTAQLIAEARAYRWQRSVTERAEAERFAAELAAFRAAPRYYRSQQYLEAITQGLTDPRKTILLTESPDAPTVRLQLEDASSGLESILGAQ